MMQGKVRWFDKNKGYGFIVPDDGSKDVFLHARELNKAQINPLKVLPDMPITFTPQQGEKGLFATEGKDGTVL